MKKITSTGLILLLGVFAGATIVFAAVQLSVSSQKVKTLKAVFTYQDVLAAPQINNDPATRLLRIVDVPAETEILSAYLKVNNIFDLPDSTIIATLDVYQENEVTVNFPGLLHDSLNGVGVIGGSGDLPRVVISGEPQVLQFTVSADRDLGDMTSGSAELYVNYLEH